MTQQEFDRLPLLLRRAQAMDVLGMDRRKLKVLREMAELSGKPIATQLPGDDEWKYFKGEIARLAKVAYR